MRIVTSSEGQPCYSGLFFTSSFAPPSGALGGVVDAFDVLLQIVRTGGILPIPRLTTAIDLLGIGKGTRYPSFSLVGKNRPRTYKYDVLDDARIYGTRLHGLQQLVSSLGISGFYPPSHRLENNCRHVNTSGELSPTSSPLSTGRTQHTLKANYIHFNGNVTFDVRTWENRFIYSATVISTEPYKFQTHTATFPWLINIDLRDLFDHLTRVPVISGQWTNGPQTWYISATKFGYSLTPDGFYASCHMGVTDPLNQFYYEWDSYVDQKFSWPHDAFPYLGELVYVPHAELAKFGYRNAETNYYYPPNSPGPSQFESQAHGPYDPFPLFLSSPSTLYNGEILDRAGMNRTVNSLSADFFRQCEADYDHITPSSLFSSVDAFTSLSNNLSTNLLQNLQKVGQLSKLLPQIKEALDIVQRVLRKDFSLMLLRDIMDLLTSTNLQYNFSWRPYIKLLTEYIPEMFAHIDNLRIPPKIVIGHGSFSKTLSNVLGRESVTLDVHSKIVLDMTEKSVLSSVLAFDALGVLPKASNLWDLLPFSFVLNWFTGVGKFMSRAEYSLILATIPAYYVHTYKLSSPLTQSEIGSSATTSIHEPASLVSWFRDVSTLTPIPRDSKFGFGIPTDFPFVGSLGSLLYQLAFSR